MTKKNDVRLALNYRSSYLDYLVMNEDLLDSDFNYGFIVYRYYLSYDLTAKYQYSDNLHLSLKVKFRQ